MEELDFQSMISWRHIISITLLSSRISHNPVLNPANMKNYSQQDETKRVLRKLYFSMHKCSGQRKGRELKVVWCSQYPQFTLETVISVRSFQVYLCSLFISRRVRVSLPSNSPKLSYNEGENSSTLTYYSLSASFSSTTTKQIINIPSNLLPFYLAFHRALGVRSEKLETFSHKLILIKPKSVLMPFNFLKSKPINLS